MATTFGGMDLQKLIGNARFLRAFLECSDELQAGVREMLDIIFDEESTDQERHMALSTIADALYPSLHNGQFGIDLEQSEREFVESVPEIAPIIAALDQEEASLAQRLKHFMLLRNMTQSDLAEKIGVGQPAISNMLNRQCRPQQRTIERLAAALNVQPTDLWPAQETTKLPLTPSGGPERVEDADPTLADAERIMPSGDELSKLAKKYPPPDEWFEGDAEKPL